MREEFLIETEDDINPDDLAGVKTVGVTAGASTPEWLIKRVVERLRSLGAEEEKETWGT
ncbi:MAG: hypothetical protein IPM21_10860 [Acidobacteria bacterium]|nr:hypothetical protein [Acidobacteriota bacterium]